MSKKPLSHRNYGSGSIIERDGKLFARIFWVDGSGKRRLKEKKAHNRSHADLLCRQMREELLESGEASLNAHAMLFREAAEEYRAKKLIEAVYSNGRKVAGLRSWKTPRAQLDILIDHFGARKLRSITYAQIEEYKLLRLRTPTHRGKPRNIATVNRELALLRAFFNFCRRNRWVIDNPFNHGEPLIQQSAETPRERILTAEEEKRLLAACVGQRSHLRAMIICAIDTTMRRSEMFRLTWENVDLENRLIYVQSTTTKTERARIIGMTERLHKELSLLSEDALEPTARVFGITSHVKRSFATACRNAGITGMRWHDLRHTGTTQLVESGVKDQLAMKITGHTQMRTFTRYVSVDVTIARQAAEALDKRKQG